MYQSYVLKTKNPLTYKGWNVALVKEMYGNTTNTAIRVIDADNGEPVLMLTVNVPDQHPDKLCIKDYSENENVVEDLVLPSGIFQMTSETLELNVWVTVPVARLVIDQPDQQLTERLLGYKVQ